jgi:hypothetical protein
VSRCKSCARPIRWVKAKATNKMMPLDAVPVETGNIVVIDDLAVVFADAGELWEMYPHHDRYVSHFATCPDAKAFRR